MIDDSIPLSFYLLCAVLLWMALRGILGGRSIFESPTVAALMGLAWVVPQGVMIETRLGGPGETGLFWLYVTGCFVFIFLGFRVGRKAQRRRVARAFARAPERVAPQYDTRRLLIAAAALSALGQFAIFQMRGVDTSGMGGQWTGIITMWALLNKANGFGLCLAVLVFARTRSPIALALALVAGLPIAQAALLGVRREALFDLVILTVGAWYLTRRSYPPRVIVLAGLLIGTVVLNTVGEIRSYVGSGQGSFVSVLVSAETYRNFNFFEASKGNAHELSQAHYDFWYANQTGHWELGGAHWNMLVHQYVPAFIVGRNVKESLKFSTLGDRLRLGEEVGAFSLGATRTGFSDTYLGFAAFGVLVFGLIGYGFGRLYAALEFNSIVAQYFYLIFLAEGLKAITHSTASFVSALPFAVILPLIVFRFVRATSSGRMSAKARQLDLPARGFDPTSQANLFYRS